MRINTCQIAIRDEALETPRLTGRQVWRGNLQLGAGGVDASVSQELHREWQSDRFVRQEAFDLAGWICV
jgi:hypothetical protein